MESLKMVKYNNAQSKSENRTRGYVEELITWLEEQLRQREWQPSDLARRARLGNSTVQRIMAGTRRAGKDVCQKIAVALGEPPEKVYRLAGLLPAIPPETAIEEEMASEFRSLPKQQQQFILDAMRGLRGRVAPSDTQETKTDDSAKLDAIYRALVSGVVPPDPAAIRAAVQAIAVDEPRDEYLIDIWSALDAYERRMVWDYIVWRLHEQQRRRDSNDKIREGAEMELQNQENELFEVIRFNRRVDAGSPEAIERTIILLRKRLQWLRRGKPPGAIGDTPPLPEAGQPPQE